MVLCWMIFRATWAQGLANQDPFISDIPLKYVVIATIVSVMVADQWFCFCFHVSVKCWIRSWMWEYIFYMIIKHEPISNHCEVTVKPII